MYTLKQSAFLLSVLLLKSVPTLACGIVNEEGGSLIVVRPQHHQMFRREIIDSFIQRQKVFRDKLGWQFASDHDSRFLKNLIKNRVVEDKMEVDAYDTPQTTYLLYKDKEAGICGGIRFLPTTEPYMLEKVFPYLLSTSLVMPKDPLMIESSRFFFNKPRSPQESLAASRRGTIRLVTGILEYTVQFAPHGLLAVTDTRTESIVNKIGLPTKRVGETYKMDDGSEALCLFIPSDKQALEVMKKKHKIKGPLIWAPSPIELSPALSTQEKLPNKL